MEKLQNRHNGVKRRLHTTKAGGSVLSDYTPYQRKIIRRYYENAEAIGIQRLSELVSEVYLAKGKRLEQLWKQVAAALEKVKLPPRRVDHILAKRDPAILAEVVRELTGRK
jgi:hypothetical protein